MAASCCTVVLGIFVAARALSLINAFSGLYALQGNAERVDVQPHITEFLYIPQILKQDRCQTCQLDSLSLLEQLALLCDEPVRQWPPPETKLPVRQNLCIHIQGVLAALLPDHMDPHTVMISLR